MQTPEQPQEDQPPRPENQVPLEISLGTSEEAPFSQEQTFCFPSEDSFSPPLSPQDSGMNGHISPTLPASSGSAKAKKSSELSALHAKTEANALRIENRDLVRIKRKQEEQVRNLVQEVASLGTKCREFEGIARR